MTLGKNKKRKNCEALKLSLPPRNRSSEFHYCRTPLSVLSPPEGLDSPCIESLSELEKMSVLGYGNGGTVYKVRHKKTKSIYALKVVHQQQAMSEIEILKLLDSEFIVRCYAIFNHGFADGNGGEDGDLCFVMECMELGSLHDILLVRKKLPENLISWIAKRVLQGLSYLHGMKIVHGDIKPSNLLVNINGDVKIADFGVSHFVVATKRPDVCEALMGTCAYMSPERFDSDRWGMELPDGFAGDIWSLGVAILECLVGHFPLINLGQRPDWATLMYAICFGERPEMPESTSTEIRNFVWRCLEKDWKKRGTVDELLNHPFVNNFSCNSMSDFVDFASNNDLN